MKLYVVDRGWKGADVFVAESRESALERYWAQRPPDFARMAEYSLWWAETGHKADIEGRLIEHEITPDLWIETEGE